MFAMTDYHLLPGTNDRGEPCSRTFDLGGILPECMQDSEDFTRIDNHYCIIASHDKSCCKAGEYSNRAWEHRDAKETCRDTSDSPAANSRVHRLLTFDTRGRFLSR